MNPYQRQGIVAILAAVAVFAVMDASLKHLAQRYPALQVSSLRGLASMPFFLMGVAAVGHWRQLLPVRWLGHWVRGALAIILLTLFVYALGELPLGTAYSIVLCAPLLITALSALFLREHVGPHRWFAVIFGLIGVFIVLRPERKEMITLAGLAALGSAFSYAVMALMLRKLTQTESTWSISFSFVSIIGIVCGVASLPRWVPILASDWPWIALMGISGAIAQYLFVQAFRAAPASVIAPFEYTALLWGVALDWVLWSTIPSARVLGGAGIVIASGLYLIYREHWVSRAQGRLERDTRENR